jgi:hypothetical protein
MYDQINTKFKNLKSGDIYTLILISNVHAGELRRDEFPRMAVYYDRDGKIWSRPYSEFLRKFEQLPV